MNDLVAMGIGFGAGLMIQGVIQLSRTYAAAQRKADQESNDLMNAESEIDLPADDKPL